MDITWITCRCGHTGLIKRQGWLKDDLLPRARCSRCGQLGALELRHAYLNSEEVERYEEKGGVLVRKPDPETLPKDNG